MATITTRICVTNDAQAFGCREDEGSIIMFFGVKNREYIFEHFGPEEIEQIRDACNEALDADEVGHPDEM
jgi:hypothetical protein